METIHIYTDGACYPNPGHGGWGYVILMKEGIITNSGGDIDTTSNQMELRAVIEALTYFDNPRSIIIFSDSKYFVNGFNDWMHRWASNGKLDEKKNSDQWRRLFELKNNHLSIIAILVKGHSGNEYNELADSLSLAGRQAAIDFAVELKNIRNREFMI